MPRRSPKELGYILTDKSGRFYWAGPGFRPLGESVPLAKLQTWPDYASARKAASALASAIGIVAVPTVFRLP
jgi:hypothetical protein